MLNDVEGTETEPCFESLNDFLASVERRAYLMARFALKHHDDALDVVQDTMLIMVRKYADKSSAEWRLLFFRVLQNRIRDLYRYQKVRRKVTGWLPGQYSGDSENADPFQAVADRESNNPLHELTRNRGMQRLAQAVNALPMRQQQAFMLRCWEGLSTAEAADVMKCSEGSVKTHYFRALKVLQEQLEDYHE